MSVTMPDTVVLIHGLWMTPTSWDNWAAHLQAQGFRTITPTWPRMDHSIEELRADPSLVAGLGLAEILDAHAHVVRSLDTPPIIIGHSMGGLVTELLLDQGLGAAGVAVHPAQSKGVFRLPPKQIRAAMPVLANPLNLNRGVPLTPKQFHFAFASALSEADSQKAWEQFHVPAPARPLFEAALANLRPGGPSRINYRKPDRAPLLFLSGTADRIVPASVVASNRKLYKTGEVDLIEFPGRSHFTVGEPGWEHVLDTAMHWVREKLA